MKRSTGILIFLYMSYSAGLNRTITDVNLFLVTSNSISNSINVSWSDVQQLLTTHFCNDKKTVVIVPGWRDNRNSNMSVTIVNAYIPRIPEYNIFILEWEKYSNVNYLLAVWNVGDVADYVAKNLIRMKSVGYDLNKFHFVGHSLGAQLLGQIGRRMQKWDNSSLTRITALDPAKPLFFPSSVFQSLNSKDAKFIDVIHTNTQKSGTPEYIGTVDFFPNGGEKQPGCPSAKIDECSHGRSWELYAESVKYQQSDKKFKSIKCKDYSEFNSIRCIGTPAYNYMGYYANEKAPGIFFLNTTSQSPFSL